MTYRLVSYCLPRRRSSLLRALLLLTFVPLLWALIFNVFFGPQMCTLIVNNGRDIISPEILESLLNQSSLSSGCVQPQLPLFNDFILHNRPEPVAINLCDEFSENWLQISQSRVHLKPKYAGAKCFAEPIIWVDDQTSSFSKPELLVDGSELPSFGFRATCKSADGSKNHTSIYYGVTRPPALQRATNDGENIIILGIDSISRLESLRSLPKASELVTSRLRGITLEHYNILGDGTPAALLPILTGIKEEEMPECRKGFQGAKHLDETPMRWIFQELKEQGYQTLYGEEGSGFGTFQLRFLGFRKQPADFYLRPVLLQEEALHKKMICIGNEVSSGRMLKSVKELFTLYPKHPKFSFLFFATLSHENIDLSAMDWQLSEFLQWFIKEGLIQNTTLIFMSDHGQRFGPMRNSMQGKLEESLPRMSIALSKQLMLRAPSAQETLVSNSKRLTTPLDIHMTLLSIAGIGSNRKKNKDVNHLKSYSLIDQTVPEDRSCFTAGIPTHWCSCLRSVKLPQSSSHQLTFRVASYAVSQINAATQKLRHMCEILALGSIVDADITFASTDLAKRKRFVKNGWGVNEEDKELVSSGFLTVRFVTSPNNGLYEATVQFSVRRRSRKCSLKLSLVSESSRINRYGRQADCVINKFPHMRKFCYCIAAGRQS